MGQARLDWRDVPLAAPADTLHLDLAAGPVADPAACSMGNPHATFFVPDLAAVPIEAIGPVLEHAALFPERANIGFAQVLAPDRIRLRVWERGTGLTLACGSGACAALVERRPPRPRRPPRRRGGGRRRAGHPVARGRPRADDRPRCHRLSRHRGAGVAGAMSPDILTFGCRLNAFESEVIRGHAAGLADTIVVNTCAVTAEAERQARQAIRRAHRERPDARIVVTGCAVQIDPARWAALPGVARVLGNAEKLLPHSWAPDAPSAVADIMTAAARPRPTWSTEFAGRARAFVQVQQGCDHRCTFCVIPFGRGRNRSAPLGAIVEQVRTLVAGGWREVVLTGVDIASYGADLPGRPSLGQAVRRLLALVPELQRLRLSSIDPAAIDADLWRLHRRGTTADAASAPFACRPAPTSS